MDFVITASNSRLIIIICIRDPIDINSLNMLNYVKNYSDKHLNCVLVLGLAWCKEMKLILKQQYMYVFTL